jgi:hypothetical protein
MLKSIYFFQATFSSGDYGATLKLGALGFCHTMKNAAEKCVGPQVGYKLGMFADTVTTTHPVSEASFD